MKIKFDDNTALTLPTDGVKIGGVSPLTLAGICLQILLSQKMVNKKELIGYFVEAGIQVRTHEEPVQQEDKEEDTPIH